MRALTEPLSDADASLQSMEDASPAKWHLAHTTWFWETFLLREFAPGYQVFNEAWAYLFNSYYEAEGARIARPARGMLSRPSLDAIYAYRDSVDAAMEALIDTGAHDPLIRLGIAHEQQHAELLLTDIKHAFYQNPLTPAIWPAVSSASDGRSSPQVEPLSGRAEEWWHHPGGMAEIGCGPNTARSDRDGGFAFDNEGPRHRIFLEPFALASGLITNGEWAEFIADGGYQDARWWLSDGWSWVNEDGITQPEYWRGNDHFTHQGLTKRSSSAPVTHISYYEADAFAAWYAAQNGGQGRLPSEFEWEAIATGQGSAEIADPLAGNQMDEAGPPMPIGANALFGDCWQFTRSAYLPYPRFAPAAGAVGEYNGKFMSGQFVLKGASCATVRGHSRAAYRNFFYPHQRWQFTGLRLAKDL
jgi:ergothioneine biosynthesis protein EgtB